MLHLINNTNAAISKFVGELLSANDCWRHRANTRWHVF